MTSTTKDNDTTQLRTLQDALSALDDVTSLTPTQKRDGASAIRAIGRILNHPLISSGISPPNSSSTPTRVPTKPSGACWATSHSRPPPISIPGLKPGRR
jgi:hypothetical protein